MERRFTLKDFFLFAAIGSVLVALLVAMYMIDRQWTMMSRMRATMQEQAQDLRGLRNDLKALDQRVERGAFAAARAAAMQTAPAAGAQAIPAAPAAAAVFDRALAATRLAEYAPGDWLVRAFGVGLSTITPLISQDVYASNVQSYVQESLLSRNPDTLEWEGLVARSWEIGEDGLTIAFRLRDGVTFSDGRALTADDIAFTFAFIMNEAIAAPRNRAYLEKLESVEALSPLEVVFRFREPYFNALALAGGMAVMPRHFYEPYLEEPATFNESKGLLLGSGPYRLADPKSWTPDLGIVELERNPRYWGPATPSFDRILWRVIENDSARLTTFRNRDIDSYTARPREYQGLRDDTAFIEQARNFEFMNAVAGYSYIGWNQRRGGEPTRFADRRVRQAMTYLTDRARIIDEIMLGYAEPAVSPF
ncbi:MAG: ABC transporter substrate-binding protein, partial [Gammaproteobacteria bacterium]|nr:ABC transporter substrate-binding protein [Gammaproteobacteria bacterium]